VSKLRQRTKNLIVAGVIGAIAMGIVASSGAIYIINEQADDQKLMRAAYETKLKETEKLLQDQQAVLKDVVVTSKELSAGVELTENDLLIIEMPETKAPANTVHSKEDLIGKIVKINVGVNTPLISSMVFEEDVTPNDLRALEYNVMELPTKIKTGQFMDVRITFPTGEDFIVLSKMKVIDVAGTTVWYNVNESEILAMSSATVDAYLHSAKLYAITYADPFMQEKAIANYPVNLKVIDLIQSDPNVLEMAREQLSKTARKKLELNLLQMNETDKMKFDNGSVILQQKVTNTQLTNRLNTEEVNGNQGIQQTFNNPSVPTDNNGYVNDQVPEEGILQPSMTAEDQAANEQKQLDVFEQPLVK
jgi:hypothetical protein